MNDFGRFNSPMKTLPTVEEQVFKNGCPLACLVWQLKRHNLPHTQESIFNDYRDIFPLWQEDHGRGALSRAGLVTLIERMQIPAQNYIHTQHHQDCLDIYRRHPNHWTLGFVFHRIPGNHALGIYGFGDERLVLMDPFPPSKYVEISYDELLNKHNADYLLFFARE